MKNLKMNQLDKKDEEIADALISQGLGRNVADVGLYAKSKFSNIVRT